MNKSILKVLYNAIIEKVAIEVKRAINENDVAAGDYLPVSPLCREMIDLLTNKFDKVVKEGTPEYDRFCNIYTSDELLIEDYQDILINMPALRDKLAILTYIFAAESLEDYYDERDWADLADCYDHTNEGSYSEYGFSCTYYGAWTFDFDDDHGNIWRMKADWKASVCEWPEDGPIEVSEVTFNGFDSYEVDVYLDAWDNPEENAKALGLELKTYEMSTEQYVTLKNTPEFKPCRIEVLCDTGVEVRKKYDPYAYDVWCDSQRDAMNDA